MRQVPGGYIVPPSEHTVEMRNSSCSGNTRPNICMSLSGKCTHPFRLAVCSNTTVVENCAPYPRVPRQRGWCLEPHGSRGHLRLRATWQSVRNAKESKSYEVSTILLANMIPSEASAYCSAAKNLTQSEGCGLCVTPHNTPSARPNNTDQGIHVGFHGWWAGVETATAHLGESHLVSASWMKVVKRMYGNASIPITLEGITLSTAPFIAEPVEF